MKCSGNWLRSPLIAGWSEELELGLPGEGSEDWDTAGFSDVSLLGLGYLGEPQPEEVPAKWP